MPINKKRKPTYICREREREREKEKEMNRESCSLINIWQKGQGSMKDFLKIFLVFKQRNVFLY